MCLRMMPASLPGHKCQRASLYSALRINEGEFSLRSARVYTVAWVDKKSAASWRTTWAENTCALLASTGADRQIPRLRPFRMPGPWPGQSQQTPHFLRPVAWWHLSEASRGHPGTAHPRRELNIAGDDTTGQRFV